MRLGKRYEKGLNISRSNYSRNPINFPNKINKEGKIKTV